MCCVVYYLIISFLPHLCLRRQRFSALLSHAAYLGAKAGSGGLLLVIELLGDQAGDKQPDRLLVLEKAFY